MLPRVIATFFALAAMSGIAAADQIEGRWKTPRGDVTAIVACGGGFCINGTGEHAGRTIGQMAMNGTGEYAGTITNPRTNKTYNGKATLSGDALKLSGCVLGGLICESQTWTRQ